MVPKRAQAASPPEDHMSEPVSLVEQIGLGLGAFLGGIAGKIGFDRIRGSNSENGKLCRHLERIETAIRDTSKDLEDAIREENKTTRQVLHDVQRDLWARGGRSR